MTSFLDTSVMIDFLRGHQPALDWLENLENEEIALPGHVVLELLDWEGIQNKQDLGQLYDILAEFQIIWPTSDACDLAMAEVYNCKLSHTIRPNDALIGHCALECEAKLYTLDPKPYSVIDGLELATPY